VPERARRPAKSLKSVTEDHSRERRLLGWRYLPAGSKPFPDIGPESGPQLFPGVYIAKFDVREEEARRFLLQQGYLTYRDIEFDDVEQSHTRVNLAIIECVKVLIRTSIRNTLRAPAYARGNVAHDEKSNETNDADACTKDGK
jgi:hypothetical protein